MQYFNAKELNHEDVAPGQDASKQTGMRYMLGETSYYRANAMFCRKMADQGLFGDFVYAEGKYFHDVNNLACNLRDVMKGRTSSKSGKEWIDIHGFN